jgi:hypothetical protein
MLHADVGNSRHFHIFWHGKKTFDWQVFDTYDDAVVRALQIALPSEIFSIESCSTEYQACKRKLAATDSLHISS